MDSPSRSQRTKLLEKAKRVAVTQHDYEKALDIIEQILQMSPGDIDGLILKGNILDLAERSAESRRCYEDVLARDSRNIRALVDMGDLEASRRIDTAIEFYDRAIALLKEGHHSVDRNEELKEVYLSKIVALRQSGRLEEAAGTDSEARQICPIW